MENSTCFHYCNLWQPYIPGYKYIYIYILYIYIYIYSAQGLCSCFSAALREAVTYQAARKGKAKTRASHLMATPWLSHPGSHPEKATKSESCQSDYHLGGPSLGQYPTGSIPETRNKPPRHRCPPYPNYRDCWSSPVKSGREGEAIGRESQWRERRLLYSKTNPGRAWRARASNRVRTRGSRLISVSWARASVI